MKKALCIIFAVCLTALTLTAAGCAFSYEDSDLSSYIVLGDYSSFSAADLKAKYASYVVSTGCFEKGNMTNIQFGKRALFTYSIYAQSDDGGERTLLFSQDEQADEVFSSSSVMGLGGQINGRTVTIGETLNVKDLTLTQGETVTTVELDIVFDGIYGIYIAQSDIDAETESYLSDRMYEIKRTSYDDGYTAAEGDTVYALVTGWEVGKENDLLVNDYYRFTIGSGDIAIDGFEDAFIGKYPGMSFYTEEFDVPKDSDTSFAGKNMLFICTIEYIVPSFCDESVRYLYEKAGSTEKIPTAEEYRAEVGQMMRDYLIKMTASWEILRDRCEIKKLPENEVTEYERSRKKYIRDYISYYAELYNMTENQYVQYVCAGYYDGKYVSFNTVDEYMAALKDEIHDDAVEYVTSCLMQYAVLRDAGMLIDDSEFFSLHADATAFTLGYANADEYIYEYRSYYDATRAAAVQALKGRYYSELATRLLVAGCEDIDF